MVGPYLDPPERALVLWVRLRPPESRSTLTAWIRAIERQPKAARPGSSAARSRTCRATSAKPRGGLGGRGGAWATRSTSPTVRPGRRASGPTGGVRLAVARPRRRPPHLVAKWARGESPPARRGRFSEPPRRVVTGWPRARHQAHGPHDLHTGHPLQRPENRAIRSLPRGVGMGRAGRCGEGHGGDAAQRDGRPGALVERLLSRARPRAGVRRQPPGAWLHARRYAVR